MKEDSFLIHLIKTFRHIGFNKKYDLKVITNALLRNDNKLTICSESRLKKHTINTIIITENPGYLLNDDYYSFLRPYNNFIFCISHYPSFPILEIELKWFFAKTDYNGEKYVTLAPLISHFLSKKDNNILIDDILMRQAKKSSGLRNGLK